MRVCEAQTLKGRPCKNKIRQNSQYCHVHNKTGDVLRRAPKPVANPTAPRGQSSYKRIIPAIALSVFNTTLQTLGRDPKYSLALLIALLSILSTFHADTIEQHNYNVTSLIEQSIRQSSPLRNMELSRAIEAGESIEEPIYVFALDGSRSMAANRFKIPQWYGETLESLENLMSFSGNTTAPEGITAFDLATVRLASMLVRLADDGMKRNILFSLWIFGQEPQLLYPNTTSLSFTPSDLTIETIASAISIVRRLEPVDLTTNYHRLFDTLVARHPKGSTIVLTIFSDFSQSVQTQIQEGIAKTGDLDIVINFVTPTDMSPELSSRFALASRSQLEWYRIRHSSFSLTEENFSFLTPVTFAEEVVFHYSHSKPFDIDALSFFLYFDSNASISLGAIGTEFEQARFPVNLRWEIVGRSRSADYTATSGTLGLGTSSSKVSVMRGERIRFVYNGPLRDDLAQIALRILVPEPRRIYVVPLRFVKLLPPWSALTFLLIFLFLFLAVVSSVILFWKLVIKEVRGRFDGDV